MGANSPADPTGSRNQNLDPTREIHFFKEGAAVETSSAIPETGKVPFSPMSPQIVRCSRWGRQARLSGEPE